VGAGDQILFYLMHFSFFALLLECPVSHGSNEDLHRILTNLASGPESLSTNFSPVFSKLCGHLQSSQIQHVYGQTH
jgi:hypothetical protein